MASIFTHLLEGENLVAYNKLASTGDLSQLGVIGRNNTLMVIEQRLRVDEALRAQERSIERERRDAERAEWAELRAAAREERFDRDFREAVAKSRAKSESKAVRMKALPTSDEAVEDFIKGL